MSALPDGLFITGKIQSHDIELGNGEKHTLYFKEVPEAVFRRFHADQSSANEAVCDLSVARLIAASLCDPDGKLALTVEQAVNLKPSVAGRIIPIILRVNGIGGNLGKK